MSQKQKDFHDLKDALYANAGRLWTVSVVANATALVAALVAITCAERSGVGLGAAMVAFLAPGVSAVLREAAAIPTGRADKIRHLILLSDSLGRTIPAAEQAQVRRWVAGDALAPAPYVSPYYTSKFPQGASRLADNLAESAYFTEHLAEKLVRFLAWGGIAIVGALVAAVYLASTVSVAPGVLPPIARGIAIVAAFLVSGDYALLLWRFARLQQAARQAYDGATRIRGLEGLELADVLPLLIEYDSAHVQSPPLPRWLHASNMQELNDDYRQSHGESSK
ncbi:MAG: hypothetical protein RDU25_00235 [Patescibacteria group bacterium]|nr:hypothetical protein [Patescibacteria group bacterium]